MIIAVVVLSVITVLLLASLIYYRRQVARLSRLMAFVNDNDTKLLLTGDINTAEFNALVSEINKTLERVNRAEKEFHRRESDIRDTVTNLSHDIRTPLTSLNGYFRLMAESTSDEERSRYAEIIRGRIESLNSMLDELFTYAKLQNEAYTIQTESMDFGKYVCDALLSFYNDFESRGITPQTDFTDGRVIVAANPEAVRRIVQNIVKNVLEHGSREVLMTLNIDGENAVFTCANRVECPEDIDMSLIFTRFYKADRARTHSSTGLGLAIAKGLAERMGGTMNAQLDGNMFGISVCFPIEKSDINKQN